MEIDDIYLGKQIGNYVLTKVLGGGAFGTVYLAEHIHLNRMVAIKILNPIYSGRKKNRDDFFKEAQFLDILQHRHILPIIDAGVQDNMLYIMVEYASGGSLRERIEHQRPARLPMRESLLILSQIGQALHYAHLHNVVHSDLKPENILFNGKGDALLADFGIAVQLEKGSIGSIEDIRGSLPYMAPEQFERKASVKSDQYALACITYELFTGERPIKGPADGNLLIWTHRHTTQVPEAPRQLNPDLSVSVEKAILTALEKDHTKRHRDVSAFITAMTTETPLLDISEVLTILVGETPKQLEKLHEVPKTIEQWLAEGHNHRGNNRLEEALAAYEQALQLGCKDANIYFIKGNILHGLKKLEEALAAYEQALQIMPNKDIFHYSKGNVLRELGYDADARDAYDQAIAISPHKEFFHISKGDVLLAFRDYERALEAYAEAIHLATNNVTSAKAYVGKANALLRLRNFRGALEAYEKATELDSKIISASLYRSKGDAFWMDRQNEKALEAYERGLKLEPENEILRLKRDAMLDILKKR